MGLFAIEACKRCNGGGKVIKVGSLQPAAYSVDELNIPQDRIVTVTRPDLEAKRAPSIARFEFDELTHFSRQTRRIFAWVFLHQPTATSLTHLIGYDIESRELKSVTASFNSTACYALYRRIKMPVWANCHDAVYALWLRKA